MSYERDKIFLETEAEMQALALESAAIMHEQNNPAAAALLRQKASIVRRVAAEAVEKLGRVKA